MWPLAKQSTGKIERITMAGSDTVVWFSSRVVRSIPNPHGTLAAPRAPHEVVVLMSERDTLVKRSDGWKCPLSVNLSFQTTLNGKPLPLPGSTPCNPAPENGKPDNQKSDYRPPPRSHLSNRHRLDRVRLRQRVPARAVPALIRLQSQNHGCTGAASTTWIRKSSPVAPSIGRSARHPGQRLLERFFGRSGS
jgi:hypothetical protein